MSKISFSDIRLLLRKFRFNSWLVLDNIYRKLSPMVRLVDKLFIQGDDM